MTQLLERIGGRPKGRHDVEDSEHCLDPCQVANDFIVRGEVHGQRITGLQANKLTYLAHAWMLALHDQPLIRGGFWAWPYGPLNEVVYCRLSHYGGEPVTLMASNDREYTPVEQSIIDQTWDRYRHLDPITLAGRCNKKHGAWHQAWQKYGPARAPIRNERLRAEFAAIYQRWEKEHKGKAGSQQQQASPAV